MRIRDNSRTRRSQAGASLLEVLIAVLILAIGLLGIAALQSLTLRNTQSSAERTAAIIQSYAMLDMMRANRAEAIARRYDTGLLCEAPEDPAASRVNGDLARWIGQLQQSVGRSACGEIDCGAVRCVITVQWDDSRGTETVTPSSPDPEEFRVVTVTRL